MLLQSMLGMRDDEIVEDYFESNKIVTRDGSAAVRDDVTQRGRVSRNIFSGTNREAMITTLAFLRNKFGSVSPGYLDSIGFDSTWRGRLRAVLRISPRSKL
jgi:Tyrosine phosphatase family